MLTAQKHITLLILIDKDSSSISPKVDSSVLVDLVHHPLGSFDVVAEDTPWHRGSEQIAGQLDQEVADAVQPASHGEAEVCSGLGFHLHGGAVGKQIFRRLFNGVEAEMMGNSCTEKTIERGDGGAEDAGEGNQVRQKVVVRNHPLTMAI